MKYLVTSYYDEEQQTLNDFVEADSAANAGSLVARARPYAVTVGTWSADELRDVAARLDACTGAANTALALRQSLGEGPEVGDEWCTECDSDDCLNADHAQIEVQL
jgi:hypothetical protein